MSDSESPPRSRTTTSVRYAASIVLSVLAGASVLLASVGIWVNNSVFNSDRFANTVEEVLVEPEVNIALSRYVVDQLMETFEVQETVTNILPEQLEGLSGILVGALRNVVEDATRKVLAEDRVRALIGEQVRVTHNLFMTFIERQGPFGEGLSTNGNQVILDLKPVLDRVLDDLKRGDLIRDRLDLPEDFGQLVVYEGESVENASGILSAAQDTLTLYKRLLILFIIAAPLLTIAAIYTAVNRRYALRRMGIVFAAVAAAVLAVLSRVDPALNNLVRNPDANAAARKIADVFLVRLNRFNWVLLIIALVLILVTTFYSQLQGIYIKYKQSKAVSEST